MGILGAAVVVFLNFLLCMRTEQFDFWGSWLGGVAKTVVLVLVAAISTAAGYVLYEITDATVANPGWPEVLVGAAAGLGGAALSRVSGGAPPTNTNSRRVRNRNILELVFDRISGVVDRLCRSRIRTWALQSDKDDLILWAAMTEGDSRKKKQQQPLLDQIIKDLRSPDPAVRVSGRGHLISFVTQEYANEWTPKPRR